MVSILYFVKTLQIYYFKLKQDLFCSIKIKKMIFLPGLGRHKKNSALPIMGRQEVKLICLCPVWGSKK